MEKFVLNHKLLILIIGYFILTSLIWKYFIPDNRKKVKDYKEYAKTVFLMYIFCIFPPVLLVSDFKIGIFDDFRSLILTISFTNIFVYIFILLLSYHIKK